MSNTTPPGWYPHGDGQRYWDGQQWTEHTAPGSVPPPNAHATHVRVTVTDPDQTGDEPTGGNKNWFLRHKILTGVLAAIVLMGIIGAIGGGDETDKASAADGASSQSTDNQATSEHSADASPAPKPSPTPKPEKSQEDKFLDVVAAGQDAADGGNEIQIVQAGKERGTRTCALLGHSLAAKNWAGTVEDVSTTLGGDSGVLSIDLGNDVAVQTWNNGMSDVGSHTLIEPNSDLFGSLADLNEGDEVTFSGHFIGESGGDCVEEQSLMDENSLATPDFSFKFSSVTPN